MAEREPQKSLVRRVNALSLSSRIRGAWYGFREPTALVSQQTGISPAVKRAPEPEFPVIYGSLPLDAMQLADASIRAAQNASSLDAAIAELIRPINQALHTTADRHNRALALQREGMSRLDRLRHAIANPIEHFQEVKKGKWTLTRKDGYETDELAFTEDGRGDVSVRELSLKYKTKLGADPHFEAFYKLGKPHTLTEIEIIRNGSLANSSDRIIKDRRFRELIRSFTRPTVSGYRNREFPSSMRWRFVLAPNPGMDLKVVFNGPLCNYSSPFNETVSTFNYDPYQDLFIRVWNDFSISEAQEHNVSTREEITKREFLGAITALLSVVPRVDISDYYRAET